MPQFQIPTKDKKFIQPNKGDVFGNLFATWNLDFDINPGKVRVSNKVVTLTTSSDDADLTHPTAFVRTAADGTDRWWALCGSVLFKNTLGALPIGSAFVQDAVANTPTSMDVTSSDMVEFNGALVVSRSSNIARLSTTWDANWWSVTLGGPGLTSSIPHPLHTSIKSNLLCIGDGNLMHTVDKNGNVRGSRVILPSEFQIIWIRSNYDGTWIGARNTLMREAKVFFWDEYSENYNKGYELKHFYTFAGVIKDGVCYTVNGAGQLLKFTGIGFEEVAVFPVFNQINKRWDDSFTIIKSIHQNGMAVIEGKIHINVNSEINATSTGFMENFPSGIWTYDEKQGLRHKYGISQHISTEVDYGAFRIGTGGFAGAIVPTMASNGLFFVGSKIALATTPNFYAISYLSEGQSLNNRGHFVSSIMESGAFEDIFKDILLTFKRFTNSGDRIVIKYRNIKNNNYPIILIGTWTNTTTFTATAADLGSLANIVVGDEIMIIQGKGSGATAHVSSVTENAGTYTIVLDEAITGVSGAMYCVVSNFKKAATISTQSIERESFDLDVVGTFLQIKVELRTVPGGTANKGDSPEIEKIVINSTPEMVI